MRIALRKALSTSNHLCLSSGCLDLFSGRLAEGVSLNGQGSGELTVAEDLYAVAYLTDKTRLQQDLGRDHAARFNRARSLTLTIEYTLAKRALLNPLFGRRR